jgi:hypothetical protein
MINGFVIDVFNETNEPVSVSLFKDMTFPAGVTVKAIHSDYDYKSLSLLAINEGFIGSGISTDDDRICQVTVFKNSLHQIFEFNKIFDNTEIIIDGLANYISFVIPPFSKSIIQLLPTFK